jgi:penicillin-binding protein 1A
MPAEKSTASAKFKKNIRIFWILLLLPPLLLLLMVWLVSLGTFGALPSFKELENPKSNLASVVYSSDGKVLGKFYAENRVTVKYKDLSPFLVSALVATEDARFYKHSGVDGRGLARVFFRTIIGGDQSGGGGSTLSQQLAKMLFPRESKQSKFKMIARKIKEWVIAVRLEKQYTKDEILTMYLNKFDFINTAVGIKSAAKIYFDTTQDSLKIEQAAMLVGMAKNPALFNPIRRPDTTLQRRNVVLKQMVKYEYLTQVQYDSLKQIPLNLKFHPEDHNEGSATYFREYLRDNFMAEWIKNNKKPDGTDYNIYRDGLKIYTTINSKMQRYAEEAVTEQMSDLQVKFFRDCKQKRNAPFAYNVTKKEIADILHSSMKRSDRYRSLKLNGASEDSIAKNFATPTPMTIFSWKGDIDTVLSPMDSMRYYKAFLQTGFISMDPHTGYVKAWVGGINYRHFKYDHGKIGRRQVGSTFKPFVYALAIQEGYSPCYQVPNVRVCIDLPEKGQWCPDNSAGEEKYEGKPVTLRKALALSINYISAYLIKQFGPQAVVDFARRVGITGKLDAVPSICLGTPEISVMEMVAANATFANKGTWTQPIFVTRIEDNNGRVLADFSPRTEEVMNEEKAYIMLGLLKGVVDYGTGAGMRGRYKLYNPIAGKTGTTQNNSDGWFMGLTPDLVSGCWVGAEDRSVHFNTMEYGQGAHMALPIWALYMKKIYADRSLKISQGDFEKPTKKIDVEMDCAKYDTKDSDKENFDNDPFE